VTSICIKTNISTGEKQKIVIGKVSFGNNNGDYSFQWVYHCCKESLEAEKAGDITRRPSWPCRGHLLWNRAISWTSFWSSSFNLLIIKLHLKVTNSFFMDKLLNHDKSKFYFDKTCHQANGLTHHCIWEAFRNHLNYGTLNDKTHQLTFLPCSYHFLIVT
jgi:hypothetical protein